MMKTQDLMILAICQWLCGDSKTKLKTEHPMILKHKFDVNMMSIDVCGDNDPHSIITISAIINARVSSG